MRRVGVRWGAQDEPEKGAGGVQVLTGMFGPEALDSSAGCFLNTLLTPRQSRHGGAGHPREEPLNGASISIPIGYG